jgi:hypothetical protein
MNDSNDWMGGGQGELPKKPPEPMDCDDGLENNMAELSGGMLSSPASDEEWVDDDRFEELDPSENVRKPDPDEGFQLSPDFQWELDEQQEGREPVFHALPQQGMKRSNDYVDADYKSKVERQFVSHDDPRAIFCQLPQTIQRHMIQTYPQKDIEKHIAFYMNNLASTLTPEDREELRAIRPRDWFGALKSGILKCHITAGHPPHDAESLRDLMLANVDYAEKPPDHV